jgi:integrase
MAKEVERLTPFRVKALTAPGRYADGNRLYLTIGKNGSKSWAFIYRWHGRTREAGLGAVSDVTLKGARAKAKEGGEFLARKPPVDPLIEWRRPERERISTFAESARAYLEHKTGAWRSLKQGRQVGAALAGRCSAIDRIPVNEVTTADILKVIRPIWDRTPDAALRLRGHIEGVLNVARAHGHIDKDAANPARWRGHLELLLPKRSATNGRHFDAMPYAELPAFVAELRQLRGTGTGGFYTAAYALEFLILTATRSSETLGATWSEIDWEARVWRLPAGRMKVFRDHDIPLSGAALAILEAVRKLGSNPLIFPGSRKFIPAPGKTFERLLTRMGRETTTHGFRSSFRDWAGDKTDFPREVAEAALSHAVGDATERAYRRGDALEKRRALMEMWASFIEGAAPKDNIVELRRA